MPLHENDRGRETWRRSTRDRNTWPKKAKQEILNLFNYDERFTLRGELSLTPPDFMNLTLKTLCEDPEDPDFFTLQGLKHEKISPQITPNRPK